MMFVMTPDDSDSALVVLMLFDQLKQFLDGTNMRDRVISVCVPNKSQLELFRYRDLGLGDTSTELVLHTLTE